jgi:hypothetical protein
MSQIQLNRDGADRERNLKDLPPPPPPIKSDLAAESFHPVDRAAELKKDLLAPEKAAQILLDSAKDIAVEHIERFEEGKKSFTFSIGGKAGRYEESRVTEGGDPKILENIKIGPIEVQRKRHTAGVFGWTVLGGVGAAIIGGITTLAGGPFLAGFVPVVALSFLIARAVYKDDQIAVSFVDGAKIGELTDRGMKQRIRDLIKRCQLVRNEARGYADRTDLKALSARIDAAAEELEPNKGH